MMFVLAMEFSRGRAPHRRSALETTDFGGHGGGVTPVPIPNTEVKPASADGTWGETPWESRTPPDFERRGPPLRRGSSVVFRAARYDQPHGRLRLSFAAPEEAPRASAPEPTRERAGRSRRARAPAGPSRGPQDRADRGEAGAAAVGRPLARRGSRRLAEDVRSAGTKPPHQGPRAPRDDDRWVLEETVRHEARGAVDRAKTGRRRPPARRPDPSGPRTGGADRAPRTTWAGSSVPTAPPRSRGG